MAKTPDETKKGLEDAHESCYLAIELGDPLGYPTAVYASYEATGNALALIQQLQAENAEQAERIRQLEADKQQLEGLLTHMNQLRDAAAGRALKMEERAQQLEAERDALINEIDTYKHPCDCCKHAEEEASKEPCTRCKQIFKGRKSHFEWRGVQKEE